MLIIRLTRLNPLSVNVQQRHIYGFRRKLNGKVSPSGTKLWKQSNCPAFVSQTNLITWRNKHVTSKLTQYKEKVVVTITLPSKRASDSNNIQCSNVRPDIIQKKKLLTIIIPHLKPWFAYDLASTPPPHQITTININTHLPPNVEIVTYYAMLD